MRGPISRAMVMKAAMATVLAAGMLAGGCGGGSKNPPPDGGGDTGPSTFKVVLLQTNDIHSNLEGHDAVLDFTPATTGDDQTVGGISRLATRIAAERAAAGSTPVMLLDSGDFLMGTAFEFVLTPDAAELQEMQALNYDAITLGNHEFDWTPSGLFLVLTAAYRTHNVTLPIVASNMKLDPANANTFATQVQAMTVPKLVKTLPGGLKVGIFGLLGRNAAQVAPTAAPFTFDPIATTAAAMVAELRNQDQVDLVIALSHSGINQAGQGEDAELAASVPGIDVILSGHTHDALTTPVTVGKTIITQTGRYGEHLGKLALTVTRAGGGTTVALDSYNLLAVDDSIAGDAPTQARVDQYKADINTKITPLAYAAPVAQTAFDVLTGNGETAVGDLVTDAYRNVTAGLFPTDPPVIGIDAAGGLRANIAKGKTGVDRLRRRVQCHSARHRPRHAARLSAGVVLLEPERHPRGPGAGGGGRGRRRRLRDPGVGPDRALRHDQGAVPAHHLAEDRRHHRRPHRHHALLSHRDHALRRQPAAGPGLGQRRDAVGRAQAEGLLDGHHRHDPADRLHRHRQQHGRAQGLAGVPELPHLAAGGRGRRAGDAGDLHGAAGAHRHPLIRGSVTVNRVPAASDEVTSTCPPCAATISRTM